MVGLYVPKPHTLHAAPSDPAKPSSQMHSAMDTAPLSETVLAGHARHTDPPVIFRYVPPSHAWQLPLPFARLNNPAAHAVHAAPSDPSVPTKQIQSVRASLPLGELVLDGHSEQTVPAIMSRYVPAPHAAHAGFDPVFALYSPAGHASHGPPFGPSKPALQKQFVTAVLIVDEEAFPGQA